MKNHFYLLSLAFILATFVSSCKSEINLIKEEEAIKTVINAETQAWIDKDSQLIKTFYIQDDYQTRLNIQDSVYNISIGWNKRSAALDSLTQRIDWSGVEKFKVQKDYLIIKVMDNTAWAILKETQNMVYNGSPATAQSIINVILEKDKKSNWKISCFVKNYI